MHGGPSARVRAAVPAAALVVGLTGWNNVLVPRLPAVPGVYPAVNGVAAALLLALARARGESWAALGLSRRQAGAGLRRGAAWTVPVAAGYALVLAVPRLRPALADARVAGLGPAALAGRALVRIPVGTVLWEEVAFRAVLPAELARVLPARAAAAGAAAVFGAWHARPTLDAVAANRPGAGTAARAAAVVLGGAGTAAAGLLLTTLRGRSGSLLAPALVHLAANDLGLLAAALAQRERRPGAPPGRERRPGAPPARERRPGAPPARERGRCGSVGRRAAALRSRP